jgi:hypothetical protein
MKFDRILISSAFLYRFEKENLNFHKLALDGLIILQTRPKIMTLYYKNFQWELIWNKSVDSINHVVKSVDSINHVVKSVDSINHVVKSIIYCRLEVSIMGQQPEQTLYVIFSIE